MKPPVLAHTCHLSWHVQGPTENLATKYFVGHGTADPLIPCFLSNTTKSALASKGAPNEKTCIYSLKRCWLCPWAHCIKQHALWRTKRYFVVKGYIMKGTCFLGSKILTPHVLNELTGNSFPPPLHPNCARARHAVKSARHAGRGARCDIEDVPRRTAQHVDGGARQQAACSRHRWLLCCAADA